ncbi:hypothetical protein Ancab_025696 [Ancistrocladus abbreviatus]
MVITEISIIHHLGVVLLLLWLLNTYSCCNPVAYFVSLIYLYQVNESYNMRLRRKLQFEERKQANQKRVLSDSETVRWLNHAVEKIWPICMEEIVSQKIFLPIIPWFLDKYKPRIVKKAVVNHLYLGRTPPMFTEMRILRQSIDDEHLILELGLNFLTADDMSAILAVKLQEGLGFGMSANMHLTSMHVEGKVLIGVKFLRKWPFIGRLRVCFAEPPYFQITVKPIFNRGLDVTELPGIAGWLDNLLSIAFGETLVEPNILVVDLEKLISPQPETWFSVDVKEPIAYARVEVIEGTDMKPSDRNRLADPYVKGKLGLYRFSTKIQKRTLNPKWQEEFRIPISSWESPNILAIEVRDKDRFVDDNLGNCSVNIGDLRDGQRHDMWLPLQNVKTGRLHLAIILVEADRMGLDQGREGKKLNEEEKPISLGNEITEKGPFSSVLSQDPEKATDSFEAINVEGQNATGIWIHHPGSDVSQTWEPRKGKSRHLDSQIQREIDGIDILKPSSKGSSQNSSNRGDDDGEVTKSGNIFKKGFQMINSAFHHRNQKKSNQDHSFKESVPSPHANLKAVNTNRIEVNFVVDPLPEAVAVKPPKSFDGGGSGDGESGPESSHKTHMKGMASNIFNHAGRPFKHAVSGKDRKGNLVSSEEGVTERRLAVDTDFSDDDDSLTTRVYGPSSEAIPIVSSPISNDCNNSLNSNEHIVQPIAAAETAKRAKEDPVTRGILDGSVGVDKSPQQTAA